MKIIVTGGAGFIGSWVADTYISDGHDILIIDNLSSGNLDNIPKDAEFVECDINDFDTLEKAFFQFKPDIVNHHAAQIDVRYSVEDPAFDANTNIIGSINLFELSRQNNVKKFIFASTGGAIYGEPESNPASELADPKPLSPYGTSKLCVEHYMHFYNTTYGLNYVALRYSNVYGERQDPHGEAGVIAIFCNNIISGNTCKIFGDGEQTRDYVHCIDVAKANLYSLESPNGIYNIGTSVKTSVNKIIDKLKVITKRDLDVEYLPKRTGEVQSICLSNSLAREKLNWVPETDFDTGLEKTWNWFSNKNS